MANPIIDFTSIDFDTLKNDLIDYISNTSEFNTHDVRGSNFNLIINLLAYITNILSYNTNQAINEAYLPTADLRQNILKIIKLLNYVPYRKTSSHVTVDLSDIVLSTETGAGFLLKYDKITSNGLNFYYTGTPVEILATTATGLEFNEGTLTTNTTAYTGDGTEFQSFIIENQNIGNFLSIYTYDDTNPNAPIRTDWEEFDESTEYAIPSEAYVYFIEEVNEGYKISFGNNKLGRVVSLGEKIGYDFIVPTPTTADNLTSFTWSGGGLSENYNIAYTEKIISSCTVSLNSANTSSYGYTDKESIEEIKFNAPKYFNTQARAVTEDDYYALAIKHQYISKASVIGGNDINNPTGEIQLGKVYITVKPDSTTYPKVQFTASDLVVLRDYFLKYSVVSINPIVINPQIIYLKITSVLRYTADRVPSIANTIIALQNFVNTENSDFGQYLEYSKLLATIDGADTLTTSNITTMEKYTKITEDNFVYDSYDLPISGTYKVKLTKNLYNTTQTGITPEYLTRIEQFNGFTKTITYNEGVDYTLDYLASDYVQINFLQTGGLDIIPTTDHQITIGNAYKNLSGTIQKIYAMGGTEYVTNGTVSDDIVDNTTSATLYYSLLLENPLLTVGQIIRFTSGTYKNKLFVITAKGSTETSTGSGIYKYYIEIEPITEESTTFTNIKKYDLFEAWSSVDLNSTIYDIPVGSFIKFVGVNAEFEGYYKVGSKDQYSITFDTTSVAGLKELPDFTLVDLDFDGAYILTEPLNEFRFFFYTVDNDLFLNSNQILAIDYNESYGTEADIILTTEKVTTR